MNCFNPQPTISLLEESMENIIVEREINRGGFGRVEQVRLPDGSVFARKVFSPAYTPATADELDKLKRRFRREVSVQSSLPSGHFVPVVRSELDVSEPWYLMPLAERNFAEQIAISRSNREIPQQAIADILNGLDELHRIGYVHRDLKPQNILLLKGVWRLTDFGLVLPPSGATTKLTSVDSNWGTIGYCAPEQSIEFRNAGPAADIYAFGCILHDIFDGSQRVPYQRYTANGPVGAVIEKCTEIRPEKRFKDIQALRSTLLTILATPSTISIGETATEWVGAISQVDAWDAVKLRAFVQFLSRSAERDELFAVLSKIDESAILLMYSIDSDVWKTVFIIYCEWVSDSGFEFGYCDVLVRRLEQVFSLGDLEVKAEAVVAAAELAYSHNRWFVMGRVLALCGPQMEDGIAQRVAIEIKARRAEYAFQRCAQGITRSISDYHPRIAAVLDSA